MSDLTKLTIKELRQGLKNKVFSSQELTKEFLSVIEEKDKEIKAFLTITPDQALKQATEADERISRGEDNPLLGIPCAIKDNIMVKDMKCTAGSKFLENYTAPYDATVIKKLKEKGRLF